jgi:hypothetical protein
MSAMRSPALPSPYGFAAVAARVRRQHVARPRRSVAVRADELRDAGLHASGRSVTSRSTSTGVPKLGASSWMPPESVMTSTRAAARAAGPGSRAASSAGSADDPPAAPPPGRARSGSDAPGRAAPRRRAVGDLAQRAERLAQRLAERLAPVRRDQHQPPAAIRAPPQLRVAGSCGTAAMRCSASTTVLPVTWTRRGTFSASRCSRARGRREVDVRDDARHPPQHLLRVRPPLVAAAQARLDVADRTRSKKPTSAPKKTDAVSPCTSSMSGRNSRTSRAGRPGSRARRRRGPAPPS